MFLFKKIILVYRKFLNMFNTFSLQRSKSKESQSKLPLYSLFQLPSYLLGAFIIFSQVSTLSWKFFSSKFFFKKIFAIERILDYLGLFIKLFSRKINFGMFSIKC